MRFRAIMTASMLALASAAGLAGCSNTMTPAYMHRSGVPTSFAYAAGGRDMQVVVTGNPFDVQKTYLDRFVVDAMQGRNQGPVTHFTTAPGESARPGYRIVVALNPPVALNARDACVPGDAIPTVPSPEVLRVLMAFCAPDTILSEVSGRVVASPRPDAGGFGPLLGSMTRALVPLVDPDDDGRDNLFLPRRG